MINITKTDKTEIDHKDLDEKFKIEPAEMSVEELEKRLIGIRYTKIEGISSQKRFVITSTIEFLLGIVDNVDSSYLLDVVSMAHEDLMEK